MFKNEIHVCFNFLSLYLEINMDKTSQKVTKEPKRVEAACKGRENYTNKMKQSILDDAKKGSGNTSSANNETTDATNTNTAPANSTTNTATSYTYVYGVGILPVLAIGVCVFFTYNTSQTANKKQVNEKQQQPPKRGNML